MRLSACFTIAKFHAEAVSDNPVYLAQRERLLEGLRLAGAPGDEPDQRCSPTGHIVIAGYLVVGIAARPRWATENLAPSNFAPHRIKLA